eukprot:GHRQ01029722.1.p2 GENE.GHRQ01029722.1~~GHRQ01029722.1.p2  ORF type:complete len:160 (+),score=55.35 GHRQ01029722.1:884-1363(+)
MLKELQASLSNAKQAGVTSQLDSEQLRQLLRVLLSHVQLGDNMLLDEQDAASSATNKAITASLEAACCCLQVLASPGLPNSLYLEELVTALVQLAKYQLQYNVLAFYDAQCKRLYRPTSTAGMFRILAPALPALVHSNCRAVWGVGSANLHAYCNAVLC